MIDFTVTNIQKETVIGEFLYRCFFDMKRGTIRVLRYPENGPFIPPSMYEVVVKKETGEMGFYHNFHTSRTDVYESYTFQSEEEMVAFMEGEMPTFETILPKEVQS